MKIIVLCVCVLGFALSDLVGNKTIRQSAEEAEGALREKLETCMTENNVTFDAWSEAVQILINVHKKPENVEKSRKLGCILACYLKKQDLMEDSKNEQKAYAIIDIISIGHPRNAEAQRIARNCIKEVKNITEECEKCFSLFTCTVKAIHNLILEGHERPEIDENEETEQTI